MSLSMESHGYVNKVLANDDLMHAGTCTGAMQAIMEFLGRGRPAPVAEFNPAREGLYSLTLNFGGDIRTAEHDPAGWEHGIALQNLGDDLVLYQAWVGSFTLGDWLLLAPNVSALLAAEYSPLHHKCSGASMKTWLNMLHQLGGLAAGRFDGFKSACELLFGPPTGPVGNMQLQRANGRALRYHWKYAEAKPVAELD